MVGRASTEQRLMARKALRKLLIQWFAGCVKQGPEDLF